jgi:hypothetical protein
MNYIQYVTKHHTRKFDNETYTKNGAFSTKPEAQSYRSALRKNGFKTRIVELPKAIRDTTVRWIVYGRKMGDV